MLARLRGPVLNPGGRQTAHSSQKGMERLHGS
jgi:hypothetical protein